VNREINLEEFLKKQVKKKNTNKTHATGWASGPTRSVKYWVFLDRSHYNSLKLEKCHYNSCIMKHTIIILGVAGAGHCLRM